MIFRFRDVELDCRTYQVRVGGAVVPVEPQVFEVLRYLVEHRDRMCPRTEILDAVWGDRFVSDSALASRIASARAAVGDDGRSQHTIRTVHGRGFQFVAHVEEVLTEAAPRPLEGRGGLRQTIRFCQADDGVHLAVAEVGSGPPLVKAATWLTHVEHDWQSPVWRHWLTELGGRYRYVRYDGRGGGLSDSDLGGSDITCVDTWISDLEAAVDGVGGIDRFVLFAMSQGGGPAMGYAVRHPERVQGLVLLGCYARGMALRGEESAARSALMPNLIRVGWDGSDPAFRSVFTTTMVPGATSEQMRWFTELTAQTATVENAIRLETAFHHRDFSDLARAVTVPTLIVHARDDRAVPFAEGRRLASLIPGSELVPLDSANHILLEDEPAWPQFLAALDQFTREVAKGPT